MNITFLMGNGFDIGIGMPTQYEDFYKEYCKEQKTDNDNIRAFKQMLKKRNQDEVKRIIDWADFEKAFGEHSAASELEGKAAYLERFEHFIESFNTYLERIEAALDYSDMDSIAKTMDSAMKSFYRIRKGDRTSIANFMNQFSASRTYNFVTFNYTRTVDKCVDALREHIKTDSTRKIGSVTHIHGFVDENMIVGVNDATQIINEQFAKDPDIVRELVKPQQNENSRTAYEDAMISAINNSSIICTYGMSIGETDKKWWIKVADWLSKDSKRVLIILVHSKDYNPRFPHKQDQLIRPITDKFLSFSNLSDADKERIQNRIYVGVNNDVFAMSLYRADTKMHPSVRQIDPSLIFAGTVPPEESGLQHKAGQIYLQYESEEAPAVPAPSQAALDEIDAYNATLPKITVV